MHSRAKLAALVMCAMIVSSVLTQCANPRVTTSAAQQQRPRVFEIRTYTTADGHLAALKTRFRDHASILFEKHGMTNIGYWTPADGPLSHNTLIYVLAYPNRDAARASWAAFRADTQWQRIRAESEARGLKVLKVESTYLDALDFSPLK